MQGFIFPGHGHLNTTDQLQAFSLCGQPRFGQTHHRVMISQRQMGNAFISRTIDQFGWR